MYLLSQTTTNVAITGISEAGKTTFLASLLWHLSQYGAQTKANKFIVKGKNGQDIDLFDIKVNDNLFTAHTFRHEDVFNRMIEKRSFPEKTKDWKECTVTFGRSDWRYYQTLNIYDFPGERVTDLALMAGKNYVQWSKAFFDSLAKIEGSSRLTGAYETDVRDAKDFGDYLHAYKKLVASLIEEWGSLVSPSTLLLDTDGLNFRAKINQFLAQRKETAAEQINVTQKINAFIATSIAGQRNAEFIPILPDMPVPAHVLENFKENYKHYVRKVLKPLVCKIANSHKILMLFDIPTLLQSGDKAYNEATVIARKLAVTVKPANNFFQKYAGWCGLRWVANPLQQVIFIASQADRIKTDDFNAGKLSAMLQQTVGSLRPSIFPLSSESTICSAIWSHTPEIDTIASAMPNNIPQQFAPNEYMFPLTVCNVPKTLVNPPTHYNLDHIFNLIINKAK